MEARLDMELLMIHGLPLLVSTTEYHSRMAGGAGYSARATLQSAVFPVGPGGRAECAEREAEAGSDSGGREA